MKDKDFREPKTKFPYLNIAVVFERIERYRNRLYLAEEAIFAHKVYVYAKRQLLILEKDNFRCVQCDSKEYLTIDHIIPLRQLPLERGTPESLDPINCRILCCHCHVKRNIVDNIELKRILNNTLMWEMEYEPIF